MSCFVLWMNIGFVGLFIFFVVEKLSVFEGEIKMIKVLVFLFSCILI